jgi:four helix bundle protein
MRLTSQLRRAAFSVPANIVEGTARHYPRETLQFLRTAWASLIEVGYCLHVARRLGYITGALYEELDSDLRRTAAALMGMIRSRRSGTAGETALVSAASTPPLTPRAKRAPLPSAKREAPPRTK